jgi:hypothetical protein
MPAQIRYRIPDDLREEHFDRDIDQQQGDANGDLSRVLAQKGQDTEQTSESFGFWILHEPECKTAKMEGNRAGRK